jgi:hypothetical protein
VIWGIGSVPEKIQSASLLANPFLAANHPVPSRVPTNPPSLPLALPQSRSLGRCATVIPHRRDPLGRHATGLPRPPHRTSPQRRLEAVRVPPCRTRPLRRRPPHVGWEAGPPGPPRSRTTAGWPPPHCSLQQIEERE